MVGASLATAGRLEDQPELVAHPLLTDDLVEAVIGLGPNLFYNSPMESCIVICNRKKAAARKGKVIFIDAVKDVATEQLAGWLKSWAKDGNDLTAEQRLRHGGRRRPALAAHAASSTW